jgi:type II secretory pathway predicted ATPase ExeA
MKTTEAIGFVESYWGFTYTPFVRDLPVDKLMELPGQQEMLARMQRAIRTNDIALITGQGGVGKSTALRLLQAKLDNDRYKLIYSPNPGAGLVGLYRVLLWELGHEPTYFKPHLVTQVRRALEQLVSKGRSVIIISDEAHALADHWLQDLRMLVSDQMDSRSLATLLLVGDVALSGRLRMALHESLWGRINYRHQLKPLDLLGTATYIQHHLKVAGYRGEAIFSDGFIAKTQEYTRGTLRRINQVCTYALIAGCNAKCKVLDEAIFERVKAELDDDL